MRCGDCGYGDLVVHGLETECKGLVHPLCSVGGTQQIRQRPYVLGILRDRHAFPD